MTDSAKLVIFGDSHVGALGKGLDTMIERDSPAPDWSISIYPLCRGGLLQTPFFSVSDGTILFENLFMERLPLDGQPAIYGFSGNTHTTRVVRDIDWSRYAPAAVADKEAAISEAMLREIFWYDQRYMLGLLDAMKQIGLPVFVIEAPHLFRHNAVFRKARRTVLLHVDRAYRAFFKAELAARDIPLVPVPRACIDDDGFMLDLYRSPKPRDNHHANALFGEAMLNEVLAYLRKTGLSQTRIAP